MRLQGVVDLASGRSASRGSAAIAPPGRIVDAPVYGSPGSLE